MKMKLISTAVAGAYCLATGTSTFFAHKQATKLTVTNPFEALQHTDNFLGLPDSIGHVPAKNHPTVSSPPKLG